MTAFDTYIQEIRVARVVQTRDAKMPFKFNGIGCPMHYEDVVWNKELAYLEEYASQIATPKGIYLKEIYIHYLTLICSYFQVSPENEISHSKFYINSEHKNSLVTQDLAELETWAEQFICHQYNSLNRVIDFIMQKRAAIDFPFKWNGAQSELIEYCLCPYRDHKIIPLEKQANERLFIERIFELFKSPVPHYLYQTIHKIILRDDPFRFLHKLEKECRKILFNKE